MKKKPVLRWNRKVGDLVENPNVEAFLADIVAVYKKHNMSLSHQDTEGAFVVDRGYKRHIPWLMDASDNTGLPPKGQS